MDLTFWVLWAVGFAGVMLLLYRFVPVSRARPRAEGEEVGTRECHACGEPFSRLSVVCPSCGASSTPWISHRGSWWRKEGDVYLWLDEKKGEWRRYRRASACPYCNAPMPVHERMCPDCGRESNPLEHPDPLNDIPEGVERVEG